MYRYQEEPEKKKRKKAQNTIPKIISNYLVMIDGIKSLEKFKSKVFGLYSTIIRRKNPPTNPHFPRTLENRSKEAQSPISTAGQNFIPRPVYLNQRHQVS